MDVMSWCLEQEKHCQGHQRRHRKVVCQKTRSQLGGASVQDGYSVLRSMLTWTLPTFLRSNLQVRCLLWKRWRQACFQDNLLSSMLSCAWLTGIQQSPHLRMICLLWNTQKWTRLNWHYVQKYLSTAKMQPCCASILVLQYIRSYLISFDSVLFTFTVFFTV